MQIHIVQEPDVQSATGNNSEVAQRTSVHSEEKNPARNGPLSFPLAAFGFVTRLATGLFNRGKWQLDELASDSNGACESGLQEAHETNECGIVRNECISQESNTAGDPSVNSIHEAADACEDVTDHGVVEVERIEDKGGQMSEKSDVVGMGESYEDDCGSFKRFDITRDPVDNYYFGGSGQVPIDSLSCSVANIWLAEAQISIFGSKVHQSRLLSPSMWIGDA